MSTLLVIGVDPGQTTGIAALRFTDGRHVAELADLAQCTPRLVVHTIEGFFESRRNDNARVILAAEKFVVGPRSARSSTAGAGRVTRELLGVLVAISSTANVQFVQRKAA